MTLLNELVHDIRNAIGGIKLALRHCKNDCPRPFHSVETKQLIKHHVSRIERALNLYVSSEKSRNSQSASDTD